MKNYGTVSLMRVIGLAVLLLCGASLSLAAPVPPPTIAKAFGTSNLLLNGSTSLTFTISNTSIGSPYSGIGVTDPLPAGLVVSAPGGATTNTCGGSVTAIAGFGSVSLTSGSVAGAPSSCTFSVNVTGTTLGLMNNTTDPMTTNESGVGGFATASLTVVQAVAATSVPTLSEWGMIILSALMAGAALLFLRRRGV